MEAMIFFRQIVVQDHASEKKISQARNDARLRKISQYDINVNRLFDKI